MNLNKYYKKVLITGGAGFIGGALIRRLLSYTNAEIFNIDKLSYCSNLDSIKLIEKDLNSQRHNLIHINLANKEDTFQAFQESDPDIIFHLAAESHVDRSIDEPSSFIESNILGTFNLLEATNNHFRNLSSQRKKIFRLIHISTDEVFGSLGEAGSFDENTPYNPRSPYSASKASSDHLVKAWFNTYGTPIILTNCSNNFGQWQFPEKLIPVTILKALNGDKIPLYGDGKNIRDWLFVEDHINGLLLAASKGKLGESYCIGGNEEKSNKEIVEIICEVLDEIVPQNKSYKSLITFVNDRPGHDFRYSINSSKIKKELGWAQEGDLKGKLKETIIWYLNNLDWCQKVKENAQYKGQRLGMI